MDGPTSVLTANGDGLASPSSSSTNIDPQDVLDHIVSLIRLKFGAEDEDLRAFGSLLSPESISDTLQRCSRFAQDTHQALLWIQKEESSNSKDLTSNGVSATKQRFSYTSSSTPYYSPNSVACIIVWKDAQPLVSTAPLWAQLSDANLPGAKAIAALTPNQAGSAGAFGAFHSVVHNLVTLPFDAYIKSRDEGRNGVGKVEESRTSSIASTKKNINELELSLQNLQQNVEVPTPELYLDPSIIIALQTAASQRTEPTLDMIPEMVDKPEFLQKLQGSVNQWITAIQNTTKYDKDPNQCTASQEISFWTSMESALDGIENQLRGPGVILTLEVLRKAKRFQATVSFQADTGLKQKMEQVQNYKALMRDFPLNALLTAPSLPRVSEAIEQIFLHINKKLKVTTYPIRRALPLVEAISADLDSRVRGLTNGKTLMFLEWSRFQAVMDDVESVFRAWDDNTKDFTNVTRDTLRRRNEKFIAIKLNPRHIKIQDRLRYVGNFRKNHEELQRTIVTVLGPSLSSYSTGAPPINGTTRIEELGEVDAVDEVTQAYAVLKDVDVLDVSPEGEQLWNDAEATYNEKTSRVELSIINQLRDRLATAKNANEMFHIFSKFNALFVRPKIRSAIGEYQSQLIENVKTDIQALHERFKMQYGHSEARPMAQLHDLAPVTSAISWARQIERQLESYVKKVEDILGPDGHVHTEGQKLEQETTLFRKKLDTRPVFDAWYQETQRRNVSISGRLFKIEKTRSTGTVFELAINFDPQVIALFKEVRGLRWLGFQIGHAVSNVSKDAKRVYPFAVTLMETSRIFAQACRSTEAIQDVSLLLNGYRNDVFHQIAKGVPLRWESFVNVFDTFERGTYGVTDGAPGRGESKHIQFVREFEKAINILHAKTLSLILIDAEVQAAFKSLESCPYEASAFRSNIEVIQKAVDKLNLQDYSNLNWWVHANNARIEEILLGRLQIAMQDWLAVFNTNHSTIEEEARGDTETDDHGDRQMPTLTALTHEITIKNQSIMLKPPLEYARASWLAQLQDWLSVIGTLPKVKATRYQMRIDAVEDSDPGFSEVPGRCIKMLSRAHTAIESTLADVSAYVQSWLSFQSLWDLRVEQVLDELGEDLARWLQLLQDLLTDRNIFDTSEASRNFGYLTVNYEQVQLKVNARYDQWQQDILTKFAQLLGNKMNQIYSEIAQARKDLEGQALETSSTQQAVLFITIVQQSKRKVTFWAHQVELFRQGETTLKRQRHQFSKGWLFMETIEGEWSALNQVLERKSKIVDDQSDALRAKIDAEDNVVRQKIDDVVSRWSDEKPISGSIPPDEAEAILQTFELRMTKLQNESEGVAKAKEALDLSSHQDSRLGPLLEEVQDFRSVWANLKTIFDAVNELREQNWASVQVRKLRQRLSDLVRTMSNMPARMRQYAAFEHNQSKLKQLQNTLNVLNDLRSDAVEDRHWEKIFKGLKSSKRYSKNMLLGDVWDLNLIAGEKIIRDVLSQAQGERALKEFLNTVSSTWGEFDLDLVSYKSTCKLIRGWDDLFAKCSEHLNSLQAMRHSPYYRTFQSDAAVWEERLNRIHILFDVWIDVQRQWVYLEGVFNGNADIKYILKTESAHFSGINRKFLEIMKSVARSPNVLEVSNMPDIQTRLEELATLLNKIQKALGEYLERERVAFPRFYFVGDEDLLEIIGNSNNTSRVSKHLRKMFAGMASLVTEDEDESSIIGFMSREGERLYLRKEISIAKTPKINEWLSALDMGMKTTLAALLSDAVQDYNQLISANAVDNAAFERFIDEYPAQIVVLASQICWTDAVQSALSTDAHGGLQDFYGKLVHQLQCLATIVLGDLDILKRKKCEHLITEYVHQRDSISKLQSCNADSPTHYQWLLQMRYVYNPSAEPLDRLHVKMANASIVYGYEYLGVPERLVRTPLTDRCFLTLTQALCQRLGGSPYGPAGTGKTESVKALGLQLGRFTLVFCCDDTFDFQAMGRIFLGICKVGAWGCFDEFNRLEERILSAVSQQIQNIQTGLRRAVTDAKAEIELVGRSLQVNTNTGIFITMNPGYAGRSNLPDNLKKLFRSVAMSKPDKELITEVMLYSQGFSCAKELSKQTVPFFDSCHARLSKQQHYDFGLRALKSVLVSSGGLKRARLSSGEGQSGPDEIIEPQIIVQSIRETIAPKLVRNDVAIMLEIESEAFLGVEYVPAPLNELQEAIRQEAAEMKLVCPDQWMTKVFQLYKIQELHHGVMMVGPSGSGKSSAWRVLLKALQRVSGIEGVFHIVDPKVMSKDNLYGTLDSTTREWTDGLFTSILRKIVDNLRGEDGKRHWIVFDGDVDPIWVENLNSVLDDNRMLTLPNGERLNLPSNVRLLFEVENLRFATLATVSRCGMVWFSDDIVSNGMILRNFLANLRESPLEVEGASQPVQNLAAQATIAEILEAQLFEGDFVHRALDEARSLTHIMQFTDIRALNTLFSLLNQTCRNILEYDIQHPDFPLQKDQIETYISKKLLLNLVWSFTGDCPLGERKIFGDQIVQLTATESPVVSASGSLIDYDVSLPNAGWMEWQSQVVSIDIDTNQVTDTEIVIPTLDTVRHEDILYSWLAEHKPLILCGPPGSGKTMTLFNALKKLEHMEIVGLNFSSATTPDLLIKTFEQYCDYRKTLNGVVLQPSQVGRWLVIFCDEINLPAPDTFGTPRAISFLRQLVEQNGFWRPSDKAWVSLDRIQFVGACNPPTDPGRTPLGLRFLRHAPVIMVDYPGELSLQQIYGTFNNAVLKLHSSLRGFAEPLTKAMVQIYLDSQKRFTPDIQPHYVYSPRELSRWVRGIYETIYTYNSLDIEGLVRVWAHEALRLFQDRLIAEEERKWTEEAVHRIALEHFPTINEDRALAGPILFSNWLTKRYESVDREDLREMVSERLKAFGEEEVDVRLVPFNDLLEHVLRIDRVFKQSQGHLILIGVSGSGKTTLSRFVAWMNGLSVYQIKVHGRYSAEDFDEDLRTVLRRCGCKGEKICFIMDESNVLDSGFLERMNTLLANAEVPGLFEGDEYTALMNQCREGAAQREGGKVLDSPEDLYKWFKGQIARNLHVVFTMNPPEEGLSKKAATSPALFNRCVLNWFGDWSDQALFQVGSELTKAVDMDRDKFVAPQSMPIAYRDLPLPASHRNAVVNGMVHVHYSLQHINARLKDQQDKTNFVTPRHFLDFVNQFVKLHGEKRNELEDEQRHLNIGLDKISATFEKVRVLKAELAQKNESLKAKQKEAEEKMSKMVTSRSEAQQSKKTALEVQKALADQTVTIEERRAEVQRDLAEAEPKVLEAKEAVHNVKRQNLDEVRSLPRPPAIIKFAMEAVCSLLSGQRISEWKEITSLMRRPEFIGSIVNFETERKMNHSVLAMMKRDFLSSADFNEAKVMQASKGVGPLAVWVRAQCEFFDVLERVGPMREEVAHLEQAKVEKEFENKVMQDKLQDLEQMIEQYSTEYGVLIAETQKIQTETQMVLSKVERSERLLASLSSEKDRWEQGSSSFATQIETLVGDTLIAAALITYGGFFDQQFRKFMLDDWCYHLSQSDIKYKEHNPITEYLSTADDRLRWQKNSLPVDDLCTENAIMLKRFNRYPLIIDPSGRITEFLQNEFKGKGKLTVTSFLDSSFTKQLESALRFGTPILIQDAEHIDPILTHVLNKEHQKTGGRVLIQLGKQDIDFSKDFRMFLTTRDPSHTFAPDICSRTTMVNFTVTQSSLQTQSLNDVLKSERPDVDERRSNVIKLQGEFNVRLRKLEKDLLQALNESQGNILDDDNVLNNLERLKKEAAEISAKAEETEGVWNEVETITLQYKVIARSCSAIFAVLEQLHRLNHFYQFSLQYFTDIFSSVLALAKRSKEQNINLRKDFIIRQLFLVTFQRTSLTLLQHDRVPLALLLAQASPYSMDRSLIDVIVREDIVGIDVSSEPSKKDEVMARVSRLGPLRDHIEDIDSAAWERFMNTEDAEQYVPQFSGVSTKLDGDLLGIVLIKLFRVDRLIPAIEKFVAAVFGDELLEFSGDLEEVVQQIKPTTPLALSSSPGFDASFKVDQLVERSNVMCNNIAMGSAESMASADKAISNAAANGSWVLIKNVHLAATWLQSLEKRIQSLKPHADFRLFLSMETSPKIPVNLLRASRIVMNEQPAGIRANMKDSLSSLSNRATKSPVERARVYLLLALLHAIVQERLRYTPQLGWKGFWEFNDSDYECCAFIIDTWIDSVTDTRTNINPKNIPWAMLRTLMTEMYGGKIDNEGDFAVLNTIVTDVITPLAFEHNFDIVRDLQMHLQGTASEPLILPDGTGWKDFMDWVNRLPEREPPTYLGLPANAEKLLLKGQAEEMVAKLRLVIGLLEENASLGGVEVSSSANGELEK